MYVKNISVIDIITILVIVLFIESNFELLHELVVNNSSTHQLIYSPWRVHKYRVKS